MLTLTRAFCRSHIRSAADRIWAILHLMKIVKAQTPRSNVLRKCERVGHIGGPTLIHNTKRK